MEDWWLYWEADYDWFDSVTQTAPPTTAVGGGLNPSMLETYGKPMAIGAKGLQSLAQTYASKAQIDNLYTNIFRTERNIEQMEIALRDQLEYQTRKIDRRKGTQLARIGASGIGIQGSPIMAVMDSYAQGMKDYDAIHQQGMFAIDEAYNDIYDNLDRVEDIGKGMIISGVSTAASAAFGMATL